MYTAPIPHKKETPQTPSCEFSGFQIFVFTRSARLGHESCTRALCAVQTRPQTANGMRTYRRGSSAKGVARWNPDLPPGISSPMERSRASPPQEIPKYFLRGPISHGSWKCLNPPSTPNPGESTNMDNKWGPVLSPRNHRAAPSITAKVVPKEQSTLHSDWWILSGHSTLLLS